MKISFFKVTVIVLIIFMTPLKAMDRMDIDDGPCYGKEILLFAKPIDIRLAIFHEIIENPECFSNLMLTCKASQRNLFDLYKDKEKPAANHLLRLAIIPNYQHYFLTAPVDLNLYYKTTDKELTDEKLKDYISHFPNAASLHMNVLFLSAGGLKQIGKLTNLQSLSLSCEYHGPTQATIDKSNQEASSFLFSNLGNYIPCAVKELITGKISPDRLKKEFPVFYRPSHSHRYGENNESPWEPLGVDYIIQEQEVRRLGDLDFCLLGKYNSWLQFNVLHYLMVFRDINEPMYESYYESKRRDVIVTPGSSEVLSQFEAAKEKMSDALAVMSSLRNLRYLKLPKLINYSFLIDHPFLSTLEFVVFPDEDNPNDCFLQTKKERGFLMLESDRGKYIFKDEFLAALLRKSKEIIVHHPSKIRIIHHDIFIGIFERVFSEKSNKLGISNFKFINSFAEGDQNKILHFNQ